MYLCYVDETGIDGDSPAVVTAGILVDAGSRLVKTNREWLDLLGGLLTAAGAKMQELKSSKMYEGTGRWKRLDGDERHDRIEQLLDWLVERKHGIALAAVENDRAIDTDLLPEAHSRELLSAFHVALQVQRHQGKRAVNKGATLLVMDDSKVSGRLANLLEQPPAWSDDYYGRTAKADPFDRLVHTPFWVQSDRIELVQLADLVAFVYGRYVQVERNGEGYRGELERITRWKTKLDACLLSPADRVPTNKVSPATAAIVDLVPHELR